MYGVPEDLALNRLVGWFLIQIRIGVGDIQFHFATASAPGQSEDASICVTGDWEIRDTPGEIIDKFVSHDQRKEYRVHGLLNCEVTDVRIHAPSSFSVLFSGGLTLTCFDDPNFEAIEIYPDGIII